MFLVTSIRDAWVSLAPARATRRTVEVAGVVAVCCLASALWPVERVTWEALDRVGLGMTGREVGRVFVRYPDEQFLAEGRIVGPRSFTRAASRSLGGDKPGDPRRYRARAWDAPGLSVVVVFDDDDRVVCRFAGVGHGRKGWLEVLPPACRRWLARLF